MILLVQVFISIIFLISSISKLRSINNFKETIQELGFNAGISTLGTVFVVIIELLISIFILFEGTRFLGEVLLVFALLLFSWSAWKAIKINKNIDCNCLGKLSDGGLGKRTFLHIIPIGILNCILLLYPRNSSITESNFMEVTSIVLSSVGILIIYLLLITYYNVTKTLLRR